MRRRTALALAVGAGLVGLSAGVARADEVTAFTPAAFKAAQDAGRPILVEVHAVWCPVCAKQKPILAKLTAEPAFRGLAVFRVDFDSQKDIVRDFKVPMQSALIVFHGGAEKGRSIGDTNEASIRALLQKASA
jgi:thioredoxin 1